jgi:hypothetical protein
MLKQFVDDQFLITPCLVMRVISQPSDHDCGVKGGP